MLKKYDKLPNEFKNEKVLKYYQVLEKKKMYLFFKRILDIIGSLILLIILFPIFIILGVLIKLDSKGPIFYRQERITQYGRIFKIFKFRTMIVDADKKGTLVTVGNDNRITKIGRKIRKSRLDEIPQLINILIGDMSFVGTRPEVKKYVDMYTDEMYATLLLPAGVTSRASINFKNESEIFEKYNNKMNIDDIYTKKILPVKMKYNLEYFDKLSLFEDIKICVKTIM